MPLTLVVLAAGMGSRYGGLKQVDPVGPAGETVLDYAVYDAIRAGFDRVVFIIRRDFEVAFREQMERHLGACITLDYAFQALTTLPVGFAPALFPLLVARWREFLEAHGTEAKSESYLPAAISAMIAREQAQVRVLRTDSAWFGVTYREDKPRVQAAIADLVAAGRYPR